MSIEVDVANSNFLSEDGVLYTKDKTNLLTYPGGKEGIYEVPEGVQTIAKESCYGATFESLSFSSTVETIEYYAFYGTTIPYLDLRNVETIEQQAFCNVSGLETIILKPGSQMVYGAFWGCDDLKCVYIPENVTIGQYSFYDCQSLQSAVISNGSVLDGKCTFSNCAKLETVILPNGLTTIPDETFAFTTMDELYLPQTVTEVGYAAILTSTVTYAYPDVETTYINKFVDVSEHTHEMEKKVFCENDYVRIEGDYCSVCGYAENCSQTILFDVGGVTPTPTPTPEVTVEPTPIPTATMEPLLTPSITTLPAPSVEPTATPVVTEKPEPTIVPTIAPVPFVTPEPLRTPTMTSLPAPSVEPTATPVVTEKPKPTIVPTIAPVPFVTLEPLRTPTMTSLPVPSVEPTATPVVTPIATAVPTMSPTGTMTPTTSPNETPIASAEPEPPISTMLPAPGTTEGVIDPIVSPIIIERYYEKEYVVGAVGGFKVSTFDNKTIQLSWQSVSGATGYEVYRATKKNGSYKLLKMVGTATRYRDKSVKANKKYYYKIRVSNGIDSEVRSFSVNGMTAPKVVVKKRKAGSSKYLDIRIKKYKGKFAQIQIRKGKGKFKTLKLSYNRIKKYKGRFKLLYLQKNKWLSVRVRTYIKKGKKKIYSKYSKVVKIRV